MVGKKVAISFTGLLTRYVFSFGSLGSSHPCEYKHMETREIVRLVKYIHQRCFNKN